MIYGCPNYESRMPTRLSVDAGHIACVFLESFRVIYCQLGGVWQMESLSPDGFESH
jgi:hypothetical protein